MRLLRFLVIAVFLSGTFCRCQAPRATEAAARRWEVYGGLALTGPNSSNARTGVGGGIVGYPIRWLGVQGDISAVWGNDGSTNNTTLTDVLFGPRVAGPASSKVRPFADFLFGVQHMNNSSTQHSYYYTTGFGSAEALDAGIDVRLTSRLTVRAQLGGVFSRFAVFAGLTNGATNIRWRTGAYLVYRF